MRPASAWIVDFAFTVIDKDREAASVIIPLSVDIYLIAIV